MTGANNLGLYSQPYAPHTHPFTTRINSNISAPLAIAVPRGMVRVFHAPSSSYRSTRVASTYSPSSSQTSCVRACVCLLRIQQLATLRVTLHLRPDMSLKTSWLNHWRCFFCSFFHRIAKEVTLWYFTLITYLKYHALGDIK